MIVQVWLFRNEELRQSKKTKPIYLYINTTNKDYGK